MAIRQYSPLFGSPWSLLLAYLTIELCNDYISLSNCFRQNISCFSALHGRRWLLLGLESQNPLVPAPTMSCKIIFSNNINTRSSPLKAWQQQRSQYWTFRHWTYLVLPNFALSMNITILCSTITSEASYYLERGIMHKYVHGKIVLVASTTKRASTTNLEV